MSNPTYFSEEKAKFIAEQNNASEIEVNKEDIANGIFPDMWTFKASPVSLEKSPYWVVEIFEGKEFLHAL